MKRKVLLFILVCSLALPIFTADVRAEDAVITRAEVADMLDRALEHRAVSDIASFVDLDPAAPETPAVLRMNAAGVMLGWDGRLRPGDAVTREELAVLLVRAFNINLRHPGESVVLTRFRDRTQISGWACDAVSALVLMGCMEGYPDGTFRPKDVLTHAQAQAIFDSASQGSQGIEAQLASCLTGGFANVTDKTIAIMYRYYRAHIYELAMMPTFGDGQPTDWDALTQFIHLNYFWHNRQAGSEDYTMTREVFAGEIERYFGSLEYTHRSSSYLTYENGVYTPVPGDSMRSVHYRLTELVLDSDGVYTASFDALVTGEFEPFEDYEHTSQNIRTIRGISGVDENVQRDELDAAILSLYLRDDYGMLLDMTESVTIKFTMSGDKDFPIRYLSCRTSQVCRPNAGFELPYPIDTSDLSGVNAAFVEPLYSLANIWLYSWSTHCEIEADDLLVALGMENYLGLPRDILGVYISPAADAGLVEAALWDRFGVSAEYLRTSRLYNADDNTYTLIGGGGGGWNATAMSARLDGRYAYIEIGVESMSESGEICTPKGTLTVELDGDRMWFCSYTLYSGQR